ncbi:MAG TPA: phosphodiester glycosidase family protein [Bacteroidales bacterium]|nr:phosphodiester glycosidase family protein [Bacteroidales bacterium]
MKNLRSVWFMFPLLWLSLGTTSQTLVWQEQTALYGLPAGVQLFKGTNPSDPDFLAYYYKVDMSVPTVGVRPYLVANPAQVHQISGLKGAYGAINGGYFSGGTSVSSVIYPGQVKAINVTSVVRNGQNFPLMRPVFAMEQGRQLTTRWVYHHSYNFDDIYYYAQPLPYACNAASPLPVPTKAEGTAYGNILFGLGGGPQLIKNGQVNITYCEEIFWGSGVLLTDFRPRTAVGRTADNKAILFISNSLRIPDVAELMLSLGCTEAINLDGGGSTAMAVGNQSLYDQNRAVPTVLAIVHADSLNIPPTPTFTKIIDTGDEGVSFEGNWFPTANPGSWQTPSLLHALGNSSQYYRFPLNLPAPGQYELYGWWVSAANRATNTPFVVKHAGGTTTVPMNQTQQGSTWAHIGTWQFNATPDEHLTITAAATTGSFVVADAIRIVSYDPSLLINIIDSIVPVAGISVPLGTNKPQALAQLSQQTQIITNLNQTFTVDLQWDAPDYNGNVPGTYAATGTFELPEGVLQSNPPMLLQVSAPVVVQQPSAVSAQAISGIRVFNGAGPGRYVVAGQTNQTLQLSIFSADGRLVQKALLNGNFSHTINLDGLGKGLFLGLISGEGGIQYFKMLSL